MSSDKIIAEKQDAVGRLIFNNPERHNAISLEMWEAAGAVLADFLADEAIRVIVLAGAGGKAFVSGADISKFEDERATREAIVAYEAKTAAVYEALNQASKPSIAMIEGYCIGGGLALAGCCDLRICTDGSRFALPAAKLGLGYSYAGLKHLADLVGIARAKEICYTGRQFDAHAAFAMGLVNQIAPADAIAIVVNSLAETIADNAPLTVFAMKQIFNEMVKDPDDRDLDACRRWVERCFASDDYREGRRAFLEKRKPLFRGC